MPKVVKILLMLVLASALVNGHVGSPDVYYERDAGPYHFFVTVRLPQGIPGFAQIEVRSTSIDVRTIKLMVLDLTGPGSNLPPSAEVAERSKVDPQLFIGSLWFLELGALQVRIEADGSKGKAELSVPVASVARQSLPMNAALHAILSFFFIFLAVSVVPIAGAIVRESGLAPGIAPQAHSRRRSRIVMAVVLITGITVVHLNRAWWNAEAATYARNVDLLKPPRAETTLLDGKLLSIRPVGRLMAPNPGLSDREVKMEELIPDHGHLMHLFLVASPGMHHMWHLHPGLGEGTFVQRLPAMPAGQYEVFADIVDKTGFPWTLVGKVDLPQISGQSPVGDDSAWVGNPLSSPFTDTAVAELRDGTRMVWQRGVDRVKANRPANLNFRVLAKDGTPAKDVEPYMGMVAHAEIVCSDMGVFAHIHPSGTVPMATLHLTQTAVPDSDMTMQMPHTSSSLSPNFSFAYGFPRPGHYRIFVQIKRSGQVQTGVFDTHVE